MSGRKTTSLYNIPTGIDFAEALVAGVMDRFYDPANPLSLSAVTILVPTRRAGRTVREAFLRHAGGKPLLLPRLRPLGDVTDDDLIADMASEGETGFGAARSFSIPPAIGSLERHIILTRFVMTWLETKRGPDEAPPVIETAARLARALAQFIDTAHTENALLENLHGLAEDRFADHWNEVLDCLQVVTDQWPALLAKRGMIDAAQRRNQMLAALSEQWQRDPPTQPIIVAGSTGSVPASAELMAVISRLPQGMVLLPGVDMAMDEDEWRALPHSHPQYGFGRLLDRLKEPRTTIAQWPYAEPDAHAQDVVDARAALIAEAMRPPGTTGAWQTASKILAPKTEQAMQGVKVMELSGPREEALAIALALREALETDGKTAALVTPDRGLARRVSDELKRWEIDIDDSAGIPLMRSPVALFALLTAEVVQSNWAPVPLIALLNHPLCGLGLGRAERAALCALLERHGLRGERAAGGAAGLKKRIDADKHPRLHVFIDQIDSALSPLTVLRDGAHDAPTVLHAHITAMEAMACSDDRSGADRLWVGEAGEMLAQELSALQAHAAMLGDIGIKDWAPLLTILLGTKAVRPRRNGHPRLQILGPLEARLQSADLLILGGLNEGVWPRGTTADPWMSRAMRAEFGLEPPERQIGQSAHDFTQAMGAAQVMLTRAKKQDGAPAVASRWWIRLQTLLQAAGHDFTANSSAIAHWANALDHADYVGGNGSPAPRPPRELRPRTLYATGVRTWIRDPYSIYAKHILGLKPLDPLDADLEPAKRGIWVHDVLEAVMRRFGTDAPQADLLEQAILEEGKAQIGDALHDPELRAFWWPRFERIAHFFAHSEAKRQTDLRICLQEAEGEMIIDAAAGPFSIKAKADRIDQHNDDSLVIYDYKTGTPPSKKQVQAGLDPQLPLEGLIAARGGFEAVNHTEKIALRYIKLTGSALKPGDESDAVDTKNSSTAAVMQATLEGLTKRIADFDDPNTPYLSRPLPQFRFGDYGDYDDLARVGEWAGESDDAGGGSSE